MGREWEQVKLEAWRRLVEDLEIGYLDVDILDVLVEFFMRPHSFTKSSCSGRIVVMDADYPWSKDETTIIFKKHDPISIEELLRILSHSYASRLWLNLQGPIYHVYCYGMEEALEVLAIAREAGFKHSGILVVDGDNILVELRTGIRLVTLLADESGPLLSRQALERLVRVANEMLAYAKRRNKLLLEALRRRRPAKPWRPPHGLGDWLVFKWGSNA
ncbi:MAG: hypothetical protein ABWW69_05930 [Pyrodictiaceae archaeon]